MKIVLMNQMKEFKKKQQIKFKKFNNNNKITNIK